MTTGETVKELLQRLDKYPHLQKRISILWGTRDCRMYLQTMLLDDRNGKQPRAGFPFDVMLAIGALIEQHDRQYADHVAVKKPWDY